MEEPKYINMSARSTVDARALFGQNAPAKGEAEKNRDENRPAEKAADSE